MYQAAPYLDIHHVTRWTLEELAMGKSTTSLANSLAYAACPGGFSTAIYGGGLHFGWWFFRSFTCWRRLLKSDNLHPSLLDPGREVGLLPSLVPRRQELGREEAGQKHAGGGLRAKRLIRSIRR
eukprot:g29808.t1